MSGHPLFQFICYISDKKQGINSIQTIHEEYEFKTMEIPAPYQTTKLTPTPEDEPILASRINVGYFFRIRNQYSKSAVYYNHEQLRS